MPGSSDSVEQHGWSDIEFQRELEHCAQIRLASPVLIDTDRCAVDFGVEGQPLLRESGASPSPLEISSKSGTMLAGACHSSLGNVRAPWDAVGRAGRTDTAQKISRLDPQRRTYSQQGRQVWGSLAALQSADRGPVEWRRRRELYLGESGVLASLAQVLSKCHDLLVDVGLFRFSHARIIHA